MIVDKINTLSQLATIIICVVAVCVFSVVVVVVIIAVSACIFRNRFDFDFGRSQQKRAETTPSMKRELKPYIAVFTICQRHSTLDCSTMKITQK